MSENLQVNLCRIIPPEKLSDRFLACGLLSPAGLTPIKDSVVLAYVFEINKPWFPSSKILDTLVSTLSEQHPLIKPGPDVDSQFEALLRTINQKLNALSEAGETDWIGNLSGMIMVLSGDDLHFSETGHCPAYLLQNNRIRQISDNTGLEKDPHPLKTFANLASGHLEGNEHILIANHELYSEISLDALRRILHTSTPYTASMAIARHLKKEKNPGIASIIIQVAEAGSTLNPEPDSILLSEVMQSTAKKVGKQLVPVAKVAQSWTSTALQSAGTGLKTAGGFMVSTVMPTVKKAGEQGLQALSPSKKQEETEPLTPQEDSAALPHVHETAPAEVPVVERILPQAQRESTPEPAPEEIVEPVQDTPQATAESIIPASEFDLEEGSQPEIGPEASTEPDSAKPKPPVKLPPYIVKLRSWLAKPLHRKFATLALAILILLPTVAIIQRSQLPSDINGNSTTNQDLLKQANAAEKAVVEEMAKNLPEAAGKKVEEAIKTLGNLKSPTEAQKKEADSLRSKLTAHSDKLTNTTRLEAVAAQYVFPALSQVIVANEPYFYGANKSSSALLRSGSGEPGAAQAVINLPGNQDTIVSIAPGTDQDTDAVALTSQSKVFRIVTEGSQTLLREVKADTEGFVKADAIQTYAGNIYTLDGKSGLLWKYSNSGSGFSKGTSVIDPVRYDIKDSVSLAIDGDIYILKSTGELQKFTRSKQDTAFSLRDLPYLSRHIIQPRQVITSDETDFIYILDAGLSSSTTSSAKVMVFSKDGAFVKQYGFPSAYTDVQSFDIHPSQNTLWVVNGKQISEFKLP